jgi:FAD/FMN-containing dehydrogenase
MIAEQLARTVGAGNITREKAALEAFAGDMSFVNRVTPGCVVRPGNVEAVAGIVKFARETRTPLVPVSSGPPHFRGDTVPSIGGAMVVDLSGLKKIIKVDRLNRVAMFEPGVTFDELGAAVAREGLRLNPPLAPRRSKSVIGSLLEREPVIMPKYHWDIGDPLACLEVIFGTGDMFRTGAAAGPGSLEDQWAAGGAQKEAAGPSSASWYRLVQGSQGTMGIATWASVRCELLPQLEEPFLVGSPDLSRILDMVHWLIRLRLVNECFVLNSTNLAAITAEKRPAGRRVGEGLPPWLLFFNIAGYDYLPEFRVRGQVEDMKQIAQRLGLEPAKVVGEVAAEGLLETARHTSREPYWKLRGRGGCHDVFFLSIYEELPRLIGAMRTMADEAGYPAPEMGVYIQPLVQGVNCHCEFNLFYDPEDRVEADRVKGLAARATGALMDLGAFFSRPYGDNARMIIDRDAATAAALKKIKAIVDPDNIMNPGKLCF